MQCSLTIIASTAGRTLHRGLPSVMHDAALQEQSADFAVHHKQQLLPFANALTVCNVRMRKGGRKACRVFAFCTRE